VQQFKEHIVAVKKTALGSQVMKDRSVALSAQQRSALVLCDGKRNAEDVVRMTAGLGVMLKDIQVLVELGLVEMMDDLAASNASPAAQTANSEALAMQVVSMTAASTPIENNIDFSAALNAAITLCAGLGFKGFGLNMALTGVDTLEKLQKLAPEIRRAAGDAKYKSLHLLIFGKSA
jgi:hypothetical protein